MVADGCTVDSGVVLGSGEGNPNVGVEAATIVFEDGLQAVEASERSMRRIATCRLFMGAIIS
jgi:hypothetical protein